MRWLIRTIKKKKCGFTLIELMIVVIIVGILAALAIPLYSGFVKRAYSSEAKATVGGIRTAELVYKAEKGVFLYPGDGETATEADVLKVLGIDIKENRWFKDPALLDIDGTTFLVTLLGIEKPITGIGARINLETGKLEYTTDAGSTWIESG